ncbi:MAG: hypothetical protein ISS36_01635 [Candidatus Aenigmarchaeota archaeon]|nr:hypothetical protein [Candidatus Aenigmarchaeota archaeon]
MEADVLRRIGLTGGEVKVYLALLSIGQSSVGPIIKKSGISSSKIYVVLDRLAKKGLVTHITESNKKQFKVSSPRKVFDLLERKKSEIKRQEREFSKILPVLLEREGKRTKPHEAQIFEGYGGVKTYFNNLLNDMENRGERLVFGARSDYSVSKPAKRFFENYHRKWVKAGLRTRIIFNSDFKDTGSTKFFEKANLTQVKYLPQHTLSSIGIQEDSIDILIWTEETVIVFVIKSKDVADSFKAYFEILWKAAK